MAFAEDDRKFGDPAKNYVLKNALNVIFDAKRLIGRKFSDPTVQADIKLWPFKVENGPDGKPLIVVDY